MDRRRRTARAGFTFLEVVVVVLILAIVGALTVPMIGGDAGTRLTSAASMLTADLAWAQIESMTHGDEPRVVVFTTTGYHIALASDPDTPLTNPADRQPYVTTFGEGRAASLDGVTIDSTSLDGDDQLAFGLYGQLDQTTHATITLAADGQTLTVTVDPTSGETTIGNIE